MRKNQAGGVRVSIIHIDIYFVVQCRYMKYITQIVSILIISIIFFYIRGWKCPLDTLCSSDGRYWSHISIIHIDIYFMVQKRKVK